MTTPLTNGLLCRVVGVPLVFNAVLVLGLIEIFRLRREIHDARWEMKDLDARLKHIEERIWGPFNPGRRLFSALFLERLVRHAVPVLVWMGIHQDAVNHAAVVAPIPRQGRGWR